MKNQILALMASISLSTISPAFAMEEPNDIESSRISTYKGLKWQDRPPEVQIKIDETFSSLSSWLENGKDNYFLVDVDAIKLAKYLMTSNPTQKEFYFLDLGAGNFQWGDNLAMEINKFTDITDDIKVNIIGVRGEYNDGPEFSITGRCHIFKLGKFKLENLEESFENKGLHLTGKIDCIYTRMCFYHLVDPVGTLVQAYNLLKPHAGLFFGNGFLYGLKGETKEDIFSRKRFDKITTLLLDMKVPFLIEPDGALRSTNNFVFKRNTDNPLNIPLKYTGMISLGDDRHVFSNAATTFEHIGPEPEWIGESPIPQRMFDKLSGDLDLFNFFKDNNLFYWGGYEYSSLIEKP